MRGGGGGAAAAALRRRKAPRSFLSGEGRECRSGIGGKEGAESERPRRRRPRREGSVGGGPTGERGGLRRGPLLSPPGEGRERMRARGRGGGRGRAGGEEELPLQNDTLARGGGERGTPPPAAANRDTPPPPTRCLGGRGRGATPSPAMLPVACFPPPSPPSKCKALPTVPKWKTGTRLCVLSESLTAGAAAGFGSSPPPVLHLPQPQFQAVLGWG